MRLEAFYRDGFTDRLVNWKLTVNGTKAYLEAGWLPNPSPLVVRYRVDASVFLPAFAQLEPLQEHYQIPIEDLEHRVIIATRDGVVIRRSVYGASAMVKRNKDVQIFMEVWKQVAVLVAPHLPRKVRRT